MIKPVWNDIAAAVETIPGWLPAVQAHWLFRAANLIPDNGTILEIGSFCGKSTAAMAYACVGTRRMITAVDPWKDGTVYQQQANAMRPQKATMFERWERNLVRLGLRDYVTPYRAKSREALCRLHPAKCFDLVFIDGDHSYEGALHDLMKSHERLRPGGILAMHDVERTHPHCVEVWDRYAAGMLVEIGRCHSLAFGRKPK